MATKIYLYPIWIRIWHWLNALLCLVLILSGLSMQYSNPDIPFIRFDIAVTMHNVTGIVLTASYIAFLIGNKVTGNIKYYKVDPKGMFNRLKKQFRFYTMGLFKGDKPPFPISEERKFNPLQKLSYYIIMYFFLPLIFITGWVLFFPEIIVNKVFGMSGIHFTDLLHVVSGFFVSVFMIIHIYFCTIGTTPRSNFRAMFNGWHE